MKSKSNSEQYPLLREELPNEIITRVDRWSIMREYDAEDGTRVSEILFYPSGFGFSLIDNMADDVLMSDKAAAFIFRRDRLLLEGNAKWGV
jgi:hypothetical protein